MYSQVTNAAWDWIIQKTNTKTKTKQKKEKKKEKKRKEIKIASGLGYPNSYFYNKKM